MSIDNQTDKAEQTSNTLNVIPFALDLAQRLALPDPADLEENSPPGVYGWHHDDSARAWVYARRPA